MEHRGGVVVDVAITCEEKCFVSLPDIDSFFECFWWWWLLLLLLLLSRHLTINVHTVGK